MGRPSTASGEKHGQSWGRTFQLEISERREKWAAAEVTEFEHLQVPCARRLLANDSAVWYDRFIFHSTCRFLLPVTPCVICLTCDQSEREHRTSKGRFLRTSGRSIPQQLSRIERRQRRISMIRENLDNPCSQTDQEDAIIDPRVQYNIGKSQKFPVHIPTFLQRNEGDPAIKVNKSHSSH